MAVYELKVVQFLALDQGNSKYFPTSLFVDQVLVLTDSAKNYRQFLSVANFLHLSQNVSVRKSINNISVTQFLDLHQGGHKSAGQQDIVQYLIIGQVAKVVEYEQITHTLDIEQSVTVHNCKAAIQTITFTQEATYTVIRNIEIIQTLVISSYGVGIIEDYDKYYITLPTLTGPNAPECS